MRSFLASTLLACVVLAGCHSGPKSGALSSSQANYKTYHLRGKVVGTNPATGEVNVNGEAIPGFMDAMVMPYKLKNPGILSELHPGDTITADVLVPQGSGGAVLLDHVVVVAQGKPDYKPAVQYHVPTPGDQVPDFALRNQDGRAIHLDQFHGQAVLLTFIYTRCPFPNFCPLVTRNFAEIHKSLQADPALAGKVHLLSISFDPEHDTPARLKAYGAQYIGSDAKSAFAHWDFAVGSGAELQKMAQYFDVGITPGEGGTITHTLSTTLIGPQGKVAQYYPGNEWTPEQVLGDIKRLEANAG